MARTTSRPAGRQPVSAAVLWTGLALGTFAATAAIVHRVNVVPLLSGALGALATFVLISPPGWSWQSWPGGTTALSPGTRYATASGPHPQQAGTASGVPWRPPGTLAGTAAPCSGGWRPGPLPAGRPGSAGP